MESPVKSRLNSGVGLLELLHIVWITSGNHGKFPPVVFHFLDQGGNSLLAKIGSTPTCSAVGNAVGFINKEYTTHSLCNKFFGLIIRLANVTCNQVTGVSIDKVPSFEQAQGFINLSKYTSYSGFPCSRVTHEYGMHTEGLQYVTIHLTVIFGEFNEFIHILLDGIQANKLI